jgi:hypothetical protein
MRRINQIKQIRDIILNHPLFPIAEELAFKNNFPPIFKTELKGIFSNGKTSLEALSNFGLSTQVKEALKETPLIYLKQFVQTVQEAFITRENLDKFINEDIIDPTKSIEENNQMQEKCKTIFAVLGIFSDQIKPIQKEFSEYKKTRDENNYNNVLWSKTEAAKFIDIKRQTIYNWVKIEDFTNEAGKVVVSQFRQFLKKYKPSEYAIFQKKWDEKVE